jgi:hypothetical protein
MQSHTFLDSNSVVSPLRLLPGVTCANVCWLQQLVLAKEEPLRNWTQRFVHLSVGPVATKAKPSGTPLVRQ